LPLNGEGGRNTVNEEERAQDSVVEIDNKAAFLAGLLSGFQPFDQEHPAERMEMAESILSALYRNGFYIEQGQGLRVALDESEARHKQAMKDAWADRDHEARRAEAAEARVRELEAENERWASAAAHAAARCICGAVKVKET
jgi:hypothetical protein